MKRFVIALIMCISGMLAYSEGALSIKDGNMISGHIIEDGSEENIPYASILIVETGNGTMSNEQGQFEFRDLPAGKYTLRVSAVGYSTATKEVVVSREYTTVVHFKELARSLYPSSSQR